MAVPSRRRLILALLACALIASAPLACSGRGGPAEMTLEPIPAQTYDTSFFSALKWRGIGPNRGGRSITASGSPSRPLEYYFGATGGGLWKTTDGGTTWKPISDQFFKTSSVGAVAVSESNPDIVYVGMGETELRGNIIQGDGVYKSADGGKTWAHMGLDKTMAIARIRIHPANPDVVYVAALGNPYAPNPERGIFRSRDGGKSWERVLHRNEKAGAVDLSLDSSNPNVLYAALWEVYRTPHSLSSGGPGSGLFKSVDGGATWSELTANPGLPGGTIGKMGVSVSRADSRRVYAIVEADEGGIFRSDDAGSTWTKVNDHRRFRQRAFYYTRIYADPKQRDRVYVLNTGFYRSDDGGKNYVQIAVPHGDNHDVWIAPNDTARMINANDGGANVSVNGGETWTDQDFPTAQFYNVFTTKHVPYHVCGAQQDNSTACTASDGGERFRNPREPAGNWLYAVGGGESGYVAPDPRNTDVFYAGSYGGLLTRVDRSTGQSRRVNVWPENPMGHAPKEMQQRVQWTFPIVFSPLDPTVLYTGSQHVWRSTNEGQSWQQISPDLTRHDPSTMEASGGPITHDQTGVETYATVFTIAPSHHDARTIWAGSDDGLIHVTQDGGTNWANVTPKELPEFSRVSLIEASPHVPGGAYLAANRYQRGDRAPYVFKTTDYGQTWTKIVNGLPADDFPRAVREDPKRRGLLYLGTEHGVCVSFDDGANWQSLRLNLPVTPVHGVVVEEHDLVIGTHGRSFYVLDNIDVLKQLTPEVASAAVHVFDPAPAVRSVSNGATIDYYLKDAASEVTLEFLDAEGQTIRTFKGTPAADAEREKREKEKVFDEEAKPLDPSPPAKAGLNRFAWDLRHEPAKEFEGLILWSANLKGPIVPPGTYQVKLTASGQSVTKSFEIRRNTAIPNLTDADLEEQFKLAKRINDRVTEAHDAVIRIRQMKEKLGGRRASAGGATAAVDALVEKLTAIEDEIYQYRNRSRQDPLNFPIRLNNKLAALQGVVESAEAKPTDQAYAVFENLSGRLDAALRKLDQAIKLELTQLNDSLKQQGVEAVAVQ